MVDLTNLSKRFLFSWVSTENLENTLRVSWIICLVWVLCTFITAWIVAVRGNSSVGFSAIYAMLILLFISIVGTKILRTDQRSSIAIGFLIGSVFLISNLMLVLFVVFLEFSVNSIGLVLQSEVAMSSLSFLLFLFFTFFGLLLATFRNDIITTDSYQFPLSSSANVPPTNIIAEQNNL